MANPLFKLFNTPNNLNIPNPMQMVQNNMSKVMQQQFNQFKQKFAGQNPQEIVQKLLDSGEMTKQQYEQLSQRANTFQSFFK